MDKPTILVVEDDPAIRRAVCDALELSGYRVLASGRADEGLHRGLTDAYDLLLLDLVLPGGDGRSILKRVRRQRPTVPVIILTACGDEMDRVSGLRAGADDYVVKPFSVKELLARVEAVMRRSPGRPSEVSRLDVSGGRIDFERREVVHHDGTRYELSERETELLQYLVRHSGRSISRQEILENVWRLSSRGVHTRTIDMHVARLREKLGDNPADPEILLTVRGQGYMFRGESATSHAVAADRDPVCE